jgi:hypothetical protein
MTDGEIDPLREMMKRGKPMPAPNQNRAGQFPIANKDDLQKAIKAVGRVAGGPDEQAKVRRFIVKRAAELKLSFLIPATWAADGSMNSGS